MFTFTKDHTMRIKERRPDYQYLYLCIICGVQVVAGNQQDALEKAALTGECEPEEAHEEESDENE